MITMSIKSCPFCFDNTDNLEVIECEEQVGDGTAITHYYVECNGCQASGPIADDNQGAIVFWNKRVGDSTMTFTDLVLPGILPKLQKGKKTGLKLDSEDCENLLKVMQVSVTLETFIDHMASLCRNTLAGDLHERPISNANIRDEMDRHKEPKG